MFVRVVQFLSLSLVIVKILLSPAFADLGNTAAVPRQEFTHRDCLKIVSEDFKVISNDAIVVCDEIKNNETSESSFEFLTKDSLRCAKDLYAVSPGTYDDIKRKRSVLDCAKNAELRKNSSQIASCVREIEFQFPEFNYRKKTEFNHYREYFLSYCPSAIRDGLNLKKGLACARTIQDQLGIPLLEWGGGNMPLQSSLTLFCDQKSKDSIGSSRRNTWAFVKCVRATKRMIPASVRNFEGVFYYDHFDQEYLKLCVDPKHYLDPVNHLVVLNCANSVYKDLMAKDLFSTIVKRIPEFKGLAFRPLFEACEKVNVSQNQKAFSACIQSYFIETEGRDVEDYNGVIEKCSTSPIPSSSFMKCLRTYHNHESYGDDERFEKSGLLCNSIETDPCVAEYVKKYGLHPEQAIERCKGQR